MTCERSIPSSRMAASSASSAGWAGAGMATAVARTTAKQATRPIGAMTCPLRLVA